MSKRITRGKVPTKRVDLDDGDWVVGKEFLTLREREKVNARLAHFDEDTGKASIDTSKANIFTLLELVVEWGGPGFCVVDHDSPAAPEHDEANGVCRIEPIDEESIAGLDDDTARLLVKSFTKRFPKSVGPKDQAATGTPDGENSKS